MMSLPPNNGKIVLITGINGYIASAIGLEMLKKGYTLRGTSRSSHGADALLNGAYNMYKDRVQLVTILDMTVPGAFDEAVKGRGSSADSLYAHADLSSCHRHHGHNSHCLPNQLLLHNVGSIRPNCRRRRHRYTYFSIQARRPATRIVYHHQLSSRYRGSDQA